MLIHEDFLFVQKKTVYISSQILERAYVEWRASDMGEFEGEEKWQLTQTYYARFYLSSQAEKVAPIWQEG